MQILEDVIATFGSAQEARQATLFDTTKVIEFLIKNENYKKAYFTQVGDALIFEKERFLALLATRELASSYTKFSNKIGLGHKNDNTFLKAQNEVVLHFPYKDCILKGAQDKDKTKSQEIFFNEILAREEIDVLFAPKVLQNFELIESTNTESSNDSQNTPQSIDNKRLKNYLDSLSFSLLLKGNNLLALHTLKSRKDIFGQVKCIYIDPPYNTGNDSFNYNDRFSHSTWLTFMKNRLEIAREFLCEDGVIFIQCDDNEQAYLKVLCDEIFGRENFITCFIWEKTQHFGRQKINFYSNKEFILCYSKKLYIGENKKRLLVESIQTEFEDAPLYNASNNKHILTFPKNSCIFKIDDGVYTTSEEQDKYELLDSVNVKNGININDFRIKFKSRWSNKTLQNEIQNGGKILIKSKKFSPRIIYADNKEFIVSPKTIIFSNSNNPFCTMFKNCKIGTTENGSSEIETLLGKDIFGYPKPESLVAYLIEISTNEGDLVMDFFAGSGTTLAVAHKMNRRYVGIEQMDYIESITKERLKKVISGEQGGVSKALNFKGGGSFLYAELMPLNTLYKEKIAKLDSGEVSHNELEKLYKDLESKAFLDYRYDIQEILKDRDFHALNLEEKKCVLYQILDSNMDYVLLSELGDSSLEIDEQTKELNKIFFNMKGKENECANR